MKPRKDGQPIELKGRCVKCGGDIKITRSDQVVHVNKGTEYRRVWWVFQCKGCNPEPVPPKAPAELVDRQVVDFRKKRWWQFWK